ncbi:hypothetical protein CDD81_3356 [Ophiocordyceps australis]|uniref:glutamate--tRNA ligase n=1 Tax=Ophiocordyceps australis TaxID=1399860 RepID=A0A2C5XWL1_9HYPO|nr:hypothetical protein CDD81_3356 [Ophiocordyceps australis]
MRKNGINGGRPPQNTLGKDADALIRVRFAPSPTGNLHLGSLRTALFNRLLANSSKAGGAMVLRIEDTDQLRLVQGAEERIMEDLKWAGVQWDEGPDCGGPCGPYRQSERLHIYKEHVEELFRKGHVYRCFCTSEQHGPIRYVPGQPRIYPGTCRSLDTDEATRRATAGDSYLWRLKADLFCQNRFHDAIYGPFHKAETEPDFILMKPNGFPTYHFATVVDDHMMKITHVLRGEEWLISTPKHLALYKAFGWDPPTFCHLGLLINHDGTKMSKRNDEIDLAQYRNQGILPIPLLCWLANLGSSFEKNVNIPRTIQDVTNALTFKFTKGGIRINKEKLDYFERHYEGALLVSNNSLGLTDKEASVVERHFKKPILRDIEAIQQDADGSRLLLPHGWKTHIELIPSLESHGARVDLVDRLLANPAIARYRPLPTFVRRHPYIFWRAPHDTYVEALSNLKAADLAHHRLVIQAAAALVDGDQPAWDRPAQWLSQRLASSFVSSTLLHNTLRLVATASLDILALTTPDLFRLLGRDEWRYRLKAVSDILGNLPTEAMPAVPPRQAVDDQALG